MWLFDCLSRKKTLWITFSATLFLTICFGVIMHIWDFGIIDEMYVPAKIVNHIEAMTPTQRHVHAWMTVTIDALYPLAYGGLFIGMAKRHFTKYGAWLTVPSVLVIPADLAEGVTQIFLLNGHYNLAAVKAIITPIKLGLYLVGLAITLAALLKVLAKVFTKKKAQP